MNKRDRRNWRKKNLKLIYCGTSLADMDKANDDFWRSASSAQKHRAMAEFVQDELARTGMTKYGPQLLRLTSTFRPAQG